MNMLLTITVLLLHFIFILCVFNINNLSWTEWTHYPSEKCDRNCSVSFGRIRMTRKCQECKNGNCKELIGNCHQLSDNKSERYDDCYDATYCHGYGHYTGEWGSWYSVSECKRVLDLKCDSNNLQGFEQFRRDCLPTQKSLELLRTYGTNTKYKVNCPTHIFGKEKKSPCRV